MSEANPLEVKAEDLVKEEIPTTTDNANEALMAADPAPVFPVGEGLTTFTENDVVLGKGNGINCLPGNVLFRSVIAKYKETYQSTPRNEKAKIAEQILVQFENMDPPGRFLEVQQGSKVFFSVARKRALEKTCQALREKKTKGPHDEEKGALNHMLTKSVLREQLQMSDPAKQLQAAASASAAAVGQMVAIENGVGDDAMITDGADKMEVDAGAGSKLLDGIASELAKEAAADSAPGEKVSTVMVNDVLYGGRGRKFFHRRANQRFQECIKICKTDYASSLSKKSVALKIITSWKSQSPPGRFLEQITGENGPATTTVESDNKAVSPPSPTTVDSADGANAAAAAASWRIMSEDRVMEKICQALRDLKRDRPNRKGKGENGDEEKKEGDDKEEPKLDKDGKPIKKKEQEVETANILALLSKSR